MTGLYEQWAPVYRQRGFWQRPVKSGTKRCPVKSWQMPDETHGAVEIESWQRKYRDSGIGIVMGSPIGDGTRLGALDIDRNEYAELGRTLLGNPTSGRIGQKGAVYFVRVAGVHGNPEFRVDGDAGKKWGKVAECLFNKKFCVIPPTIHPNTNAPYRWIGKPLHEVDLLTLPLIGA
jgi:hypothetical protein